MLLSKRKNVGVWFLLLAAVGIGAGCLLYGLTAAADSPRGSGAPRLDEQLAQAGPRETEILEKSKTQKRDSTGDSRIRTALNELTKVEFIDTPLLECLNILKTLHKIEIVLDMPVLEEEGISENLPINVSISNISMRNVLNLILVPRKLDYVVKDEVLLVTTRPVADKTFNTEVYQLKDLGPDTTAKELAAAIAETIAPESWQEKGGGKVSLLNGKLIIRQTERNHHEISELLKKLAELARDEADPRH